MPLLDDVVAKALRKVPAGYARQGDTLIDEAGNVFTPVGTTVDGRIIFRNAEGTPVVLDDVPTGNPTIRLPDNASGQGGGAEVNVGTHNVPIGGFGPMRRVVDDPTLDGILVSNYGQVSISGARIGNGGTADALRYENATGELLSPSGHQQAAEQMRIRLQTYVRRATNSPNPNNAGTIFIQRDIDYANELIADLNDVLGN